MHDSAGQKEGLNLRIQPRSSRKNRSFQNETVAFGHIPRSGRWSSQAVWRTVWHRDPSNGDRQRINKGTNPHSSRHTRVFPFAGWNTRGRSRGKRAAFSTDRQVETGGDHTTALSVLINRFNQSFQSGHRSPNANRLISERARVMKSKQQPLEKRKHRHPSAIAHGARLNGRSASEVQRMQRRVRQCMSSAHIVKNRARWYGF